MNDRTALIPYSPSTSLGRAQLWSTIDPSVRRRRAMEIASMHDQAGLCDLLYGYMLVKSRMHSTVSGNTIKAYRLGVAELLRAWHEENLLHPSQDAGDRYVSTLSGHLSPASIDARLHGAKALYRALRWAHATEADPFGDVRAPRNPTPRHERRRPYSDSDVDKLLSVADNVQAALILLCAHGGLRISEALALRWEDLDLSRLLLRVRSGKGGASRTVHMSSSLTESLARISGTPYRGPVFRNAYDRAFADPTIPRNHLQVICRAAGVPYLGFHALRHTAGTRLLRESNNLQLVAAHLGHADISTTSIYAKWSDDQLSAAIWAW